MKNSLLAWNIPNWQIIAKITVWSVSIFWKQILREKMLGIIFSLKTIDILTPRVLKLLQKAYLKSWNP